MPLRVVNRSGAGVSESVCYDALNRITGYNAPDAACSGSGTVTVVYDDSGNIMEKTDVCAQFGCYSYAQPGNVRPHAISSLGATFNGVSDPTFTYDNNGNLTSGAGRTITYTGFNMVSQMTDGTSNLCWTYDADHQRVRMDQSACGGSPVSTTYYLNDSISGAMAEKIVSGSNTTWKDYLFVSGAMIGTRMVVNGGTASETYYVLDKMGSVAATSDQTGVLLCRIAYDAWGSKTASGSSCIEPTREFTGEESINTGALVGLVNLNARVYDPVLGRFMSADPLSGNPFNGQNLNAYTYALNSPLLYTDPTGEQTVCYQLGGSNGSGGYNGNLGTYCFDNGSYSGPGSGFSPDTSIFSGSFGGAINDEDGPSSTTIDWGVGGVPPTVRGQAGNTSLAGTTNNTVPTILGQPIRYDGTLLKFTIDPLVGSAAAQYGFGGSDGVFGPSWMVSPDSPTDNPFEPGTPEWFKQQELLLSDALFVISSVIPFERLVGLAADLSRSIVKGLSFFDAAADKIGIGPFAGGSILARSAARDFTSGERAEINRIGKSTGCHTCGTTDPGTTSGNFVPDHQPSSSLDFGSGPQRLYPQCLTCSRDQGLAIARFLRGLSDQ